MMTHSQEKRQQDDQDIPLEIDTHYSSMASTHGKSNTASDAPVGSKRIDEFGFCACGGVQ